MLHSWPALRKALTAVDLSTHLPKARLQLLAPKNKYTFRPIQLIDPIDMLYLTALVLRFVPTFEQARLGGDIVHSFHVRHGKDGSIHLDSRWESWAAAIGKRLAKSEMVAKADIVDFFPRVYLHRLEN
jgi:hypothetical protein